MRLKGMNEEQYGCPLQTDFGQVWIYASDAFITGITLHGENRPVTFNRETPLLCQAAEQLTEYLQGKRRIFTFPVFQPTSAFQARVYQETACIPYGQTRSYQAVAKGLGQPRAYRAVGQALHRNRLPIVIPCHRVMGTKGQWVGFAAGIAIKQYLVQLEARGCIAEREEYKTN